MTTSTLTRPATHDDLDAALERAVSDYLAISRNGHLYSSDMSREMAEASAWERMQDALRAKGLPTG